MYCLTAYKIGENHLEEVGHSKMKKSWKTLKAACRNAYLLLKEDPTLHVDVVKVGRPDKWSISFYMTKHFGNYTGVVFGLYKDEEGYSHNKLAVIIVEYNTKIYGRTVSYQSLYRWSFDTFMNNLVQLDYLYYNIL